MSQVTVEELKSLVESIFTLKAECELKDAELTAMNKELARREQKCIEYLRELNLKTFDSPHGKVTPGEVTSFAVPKTPDDRQQFFAYLKEQELFDGMVTVNYQTLNSWAKEWYTVAKEKGDLSATIPGLGAPNITHRLYKTKRGTS